jgi:anaerobic magnesium-protoporphyrin IX monomethyl ester cyclase
MLMKVLTLNPPFLPKFSRTSRSPAVTKGGTIYYPIWLAYTTGVLEDNGFQVQLIDAPARGYDLDYVIKKTRKFKPSLIVIDTSTPSVYNDIKVAEALKDATNAFIILVGTHVSALPEQSLKISKKIDAVARHEYDYTILELAKFLEAGKRLNTVKGLTYRVGSKIISNPDRPFIKDLDTLPFVSKVYKRHLNIEDYFYAANLHPVVTIIGGRGCIYRCAFCVWPQVMSGHQYRMRSPENIVEELEYIKKEMPQVREVFFEDDTGTVNKEHMLKLCRLIKERGLDITWSTNARADIPLDVLKEMKSAGCRLLCVGYESGSQEVLNKVHKGTTLGKIKQFAKDAKKAGIMVHGCFILGLPYDTRKTIEETIEFAKELDPDTAQFYPVMVYPGTEAYEWSKREGYLITEDYSKWLTPEGWHNCMVSRPDISNKDLVKLCDEARIRFYFRPSYILKRLKLSMTDINEAKRTVKSGKTFFNYLFKLMKKKTIPKRSKEKK